MENNRNSDVNSTPLSENRSGAPQPPQEVPVLPAFVQGVDADGWNAVKAFFTTRRAGFSEGPYASLNLGFHTGDDAGAVGKNWETLLRAQGLATPTRPEPQGPHAVATAPRLPVMPRLCHGAALLDADDPRAVAAHAGADAVFTRVRGRVLAVTTADCLAALIVDAEAGCAAAVHAGWRGTRDNILGRTLTHLFAAGFCRPATTHIALGPCLSPAALEIADDVAATLPDVHVVRFAGRPHFDLRGCNRAQALAAGVPADHIASVGGCTYGEPDLYFSYRRDGGVTGRMAACIVLT